MNKQDRSRVRNAEDLERKYNFTAMKKAIELNELGLNKTNTEMENFVDSVLGSLDNMQNQIDGKVDTYYYNGVPSLDTLPASEWSEEDYKSHVGDQYYDKDTGTAYKFTYNSDTDSYSWTQINASAAMEALAIANAAKDTADSKRTVFTSQPYPPYSNGDLWIKNKELYVCQISRDTGEIFYENDFIIATKYTDDTYAIGVEKDLTVLSGTVTEIQTDVAFYKVTVEQQTEIVNSLGETVETLGKKQAQLEVTADKINWIVADGTDASNFTMTSGAVNIMTDALGIDALVEFKNSAVNGTSTVINGGAIDTDSLFSRYIEATDIHILGESTIGDVDGNHLLIVGNKLYIRDGAMDLASFGSDLIELGKGNKDAVVSLCGEVAELKATQSDYGFDELLISSDYGIAHKAQNITLDALYEGPDVSNWGRFKSKATDTYVRTEIYARFDGGNYNDASVSLASDYSSSYVTIIADKINLYGELNFYPVGSVIMTSENTNPGEYIEGTWELIDKEFKSVYEGSLSSAFSATNCSSVSCYVTRTGHTIQLRLQANNAVALSDATVILGNFVPSILGVTSLGMSYRHYSAPTDAGNAILVLYIDGTELGCRDVIGKTSGEITGTGNQFTLNVDWNLEYTYLLDAYCDKFYWERTA